MGNPDRMSGKLTQNCWFGFEGRSARLILISRKNAEDENTAEKKRGGKTHWDFTALFSSIPISHGYCQRSNHTSLPPSYHDRRYFFFFFEAAIR